MTPEDAKKLRKLIANYEKAAGALMRERDRLFPIGTKVGCKITNRISTVRGGSFYADQILTDIGHMGFTYVEIVK